MVSVREREQQSEIGGWRFVVVWVGFGQGRRAAERDRRVVWVGFLLGHMGFCASCDGGSWSLGSGLGFFSDV